MIPKGVGFAVIMLIIYFGGFLAGYGCGRNRKKGGE